MFNTDPLRKKVLNLARQKLIFDKREAGRSFPVFRKPYFPHYNYTPDAEFHLELSSLLDTITKKRGVKLAIAAPRASAKSTIVTLQYVLYCICYKAAPFIVIVSNTRDQAVGYLTDIKKELEANERLIRDFPEVCEIGKNQARRDGPGKRSSPETASGFWRWAQASRSAASATGSIGHP